ncbi:hypothetical protein ABPG75_003521 [Micractinium tetrahymenae]
MHFHPQHMPLPASLTRLHLDFEKSGELTALTRLHTLSLVWADPQGDALASLPSLRSLALLQCFTWPDCISQLTGLEALTLNDARSILDAMVEDPGASTAAVAAALPQLQRLTHLALVWPVGYPAPLAELAAMSSLRSLFWPAAGWELPAGAYLSSLTRLVTRAEALPALAPAEAAEAAPSLRFLGLWCEEQDEAALHGTLRWLSQLPPLRRALLAASEARFGRCVQAVVGAQRAAPHLAIDCFTDVSDSMGPFLHACGDEYSPP